MRAMSGSFLDREEKEKTPPKKEDIYIYINTKKFEEVGVGTPNTSPTSPSSHTPPAQSVRPCPVHQARWASRHRVRDSQVRCDTSWAMRGGLERPTLPWELTWMWMAGPQVRKTMPSTTNRWWFSTSMVVSGCSRESQSDRGRT